MREVPMPWRLVLTSALIAVLLIACNPPTDSGTTVREGVGVRDYYTVRSDPGGTQALVSRDMPPSPRPREAITSDDYFGLKLEHIYAGGMLGREVSNIALVAEIGGIIPEGIRCEEFPEEELGIQVSSQARDNRRTGGDCRYKTVLQINPVFRDAHVTFDSVFITPPFRAGFEPLRLQFIVARLENVELARQIMRWAEETTQRLQNRGALRFQEWQRQLVNVGFTAANYILDYASQPTYVLEFTTEFVPVESVEGAIPQSLLMGGDFVIVGRPAVDGFAPDGAQTAINQLYFDSGRLYWRSTRQEYTESPYLIFKVVRYGRYPGMLPIQLPTLVRSMQSGASSSEVISEARSTLTEMQAARTLNETEGALLLALMRWAAESIELGERLSAGRYDQLPVPMVMSELPATFAAGLKPLDDLEAAAEAIRRLQSRLYDEYGRTPGLRQEECVVLRSLTQELADGYRARLPGVRTTFESMQVRRLRLQRSGADASESERQEFESLSRTEVALHDRITALPDVLEEPACPGMRQAWTVLEPFDSLARGE